ncbi:solute carrier family 35 member F2-like [Clavelina lepadiformis]
MDNQSVSEINQERTSNVKYSCDGILSKIVSSLKPIFTWKILKPVLYGQVLSVLICGTAITSNYLSEDKIEIPLTQSFINYVLLFFTYTMILCVRKNEDGKPILFQVLRKNWWRYALLSTIDVEANFMVVLAYQYTSLTSVQLLDCFVIPVVMLLSYFLLKVRYIHVHYIGVTIALVGVACMVGADVLVGKGGVGSNPALGDILVLAGAVCYGITNVSMEFISKKHNNGNIEYLGMYGLFCPLVCGIQMAILEHDKLAAIVWTPKVILLLAGFGVCMYLLYSFMPIVMKLSSATAVNISLLTADLYALFSGLFLFGYKLSPLYIVSFVTIVIALVIYNSMQPTHRNDAVQQPCDSSSMNSLTLPANDEAEPLNHDLGTWFSKSNSAGEV